MKKVIFILSCCLINTSKIFSQSYLPLTGGTLTGQLNGTTATFTKAAYTKGGNNYHVELYSPDQNISSTEITLRFHHSNWWWKSIRASELGFRFTNGYDNTPADIYSGRVLTIGGGVDGNFSDAFTSLYAANETEKNTIQSSVSSIASLSGFRFLTSNGAGSANQTKAMDILRDRQILYGKVGIGTPNPGNNLSIYDQGNPSLEISAGNVPHFFLRNGNNVASTFTVYNDNTLRIGMEYNSGTNHLVITQTGNIGMGTTNPGIYKLAVEGTIGARKLKVTQGSWADDVFKANYRLMPITELENFIQKNNHLPGVPSEKEVKGKDLDISETQTMLLKKIEELTLYILKLNNEVKVQRSEITSLKKLIKKD